MTTAAHMTPLRAASAEKLAAAVGDADDAVDDGATPDAAIAKAARDHGVPVGHVPFLVRAFNTGRAVRQLGAADPWEKAANHPIAAIPAVLSILAAPGESVAKVAAADRDAGADYYSAPPDPGPRYVLPPMVSPAEKRASAYRREEPEPRQPAPRPRDPSLGLVLRAGHQLVKLADELTALTAPQYLAVKAAAEEVAPDAALFAFSYVEAGDPWLRAKGASAARPDPLITTDHPAVAVLRELSAIRAAFPKSAAVSAPDGCAPVTIMGTAVEGWYERRPLDPLFGLPVPEKTAAAPRTPTRAPTVFDPPQPSAPSPVSEGVAKRAGFGAGFGSVFNAGMSKLRSHPMVGEALANSWKPRDPSEVSATGLNAGLAGVDEHAAIQSILADPRFIKADPQTLVQTYRDLSSLAPRAMQNPAVASDFLTRKIQTGPLGYHDLEALTRLEKNLADVQRHARPDPDDGD